MKSLSTAVAAQVAVTIFTSRILQAELPVGSALFPTLSTNNALYRVTPLPVATMAATALFEADARNSTAAAYPIRKQRLCKRWEMQRRVRRIVFPRSPGVARPPSYRFVKRER